MPKRHCVFTENFTNFFSNLKKTENVWERNLGDFRRLPFGDYIHVTFISQRPIKLYFIYYPVEQTF